MSPAMSQSMSSSTRYGEALKGKIKAERLMSVTLSFNRGYCSASLSMSLALMARNLSAFSTATSGAISPAAYSDSVVTAMGSMLSSVSALENTFNEGRALGVNWSALTDARRPRTLIAEGMVRRRSGIRRYDGLCEYASRFDGVPRARPLVCPLAARVDGVPRARVCGSAPGRRVRNARFRRPRVCGRRVRPPSSAHRVLRHALHGRRRPQRRAPRRRTTTAAASR